MAYKKYYPLIYNERFPNEPENAPGSAGAAELRIRRSDPGFKRLVQNNNPDIIFRDEENTGADRMMTYKKTLAKLFGTLEYAFFRYGCGWMMAIFFGSVWLIHSGLDDAMRVN
ncbi:hedgehog amino-terminal signaling domain protein [Trichinella nativa]|uniref:Hedgehog amino-terminal signaling domain protein n=1 Tax=Trichinella nativa TaxID=6335 RepID=A0A1Y3EXC0_9BILA|nr:hedgehog amino-terminal signaling domain protein [Trichinella nativa]